MRSAKSISAHHAPRASMPRVAVRMVKRRQSLFTSDPEPDSRSRTSCAISVNGNARRCSTPLLDAGHLAAMKNGTETGREAPRLKDHESLLEEFPARPSFFVRIEDGWLDTGDFATGDLVAVRTGGRTQDGDVVLARVGETPTLPRFARIDSRTAHLNALGTGSKLRPVPVGQRTQEAKIVGLVVGAIVGTGRATKA